MSCAWTESACRIISSIWVGIPCWRHRLSHGFVPPSASISPSRCCLTLPRSPDWPPGLRQKGAITHPVTNNLWWRPQPIRMAAASRPSPSPSSGCGSSPRSQQAMPFTTSWFLRRLRDTSTLMLWNAPSLSWCAATRGCAPHLPVAMANRCRLLPRYRRCRSKWSICATCQAIGAAANCSGCVTPKPRAPSTWRAAPWRASSWCCSKRGARCC